MAKTIQEFIHYCHKRGTLFMRSDEIAELTMFRKNYIKDIEKYKEVNQDLAFKWIDKIKIDTK